MRWQRFTSVLRARDREFVRDRSALAWNIIFPLLIILGFAFAFTGDQLDQYKIGVIGQAEDSLIAFYETDYINFIEVKALEKSRGRAIKKAAGAAFMKPEHGAF